MEARFLKEGKQDIKCENEEDRIYLSVRGKLLRSLQSAKKITQAPGVSTQTRGEGEGTRSQVAVKI